MGALGTPKVTDRPVPIAEALLHRKLPFYDDHRTRDGA
jgi:hypothetical protein